MQTLETYWLADSAFVAGGEVSIADILLLTELDMLHLLAWAQEVRTEKPFVTLQSSLIDTFKAYQGKRLGKDQCAVLLF